MSCQVSIYRNNAGAAHPLRQQLWASLGLISFLLLSVLALKFAAPLVHLLPRCVLYDLLSLPCPTCGTTRALLACARGDFAAAFVGNPLTAMIYLSLFVAAGLLLAATVVHKNVLRFFSAAHLTIMRRMAALALGANWIYLLARESMK